MNTEEVEEEEVLGGEQEEKPEAVDTAAAASGADTGASPEGHRGAASAGPGQMTYAEARAVVRGLRLRGAYPSCKASTAWHHWRRNNAEMRKDLGLPVEPNKVYAEEEGFEWDDFVGAEGAEAPEEEPSVEAMDEVVAPQEDEGLMAPDGKEPHQTQEEAAEEPREEPDAEGVTEDPQQEGQGKKSSSAAGKGLEFLPFQKARDVVRGLRLRSAYPSCKASTAWSNWYRKNLETRRELHLPSQPDAVYKKDGFDWDDFVGGGAAGREEDAAVEEAVLEEEEEHPDASEDVQEGTADTTFRAEPPQKRRSSAASKGVGFLRFQEAREAARGLDLRSAYPSLTARKAWKQWCNGNESRRKELGLPDRPDVKYRMEEGFDLDDFVFGSEKRGPEASEEEEEDERPQTVYEGAEEEHPGALEASEEGEEEHPGALEASEEGEKEHPGALEASEEGEKEHPGALQASEEGEKEDALEAAAAAAAEWMPFEEARALVWSLRLPVRKGHPQKVFWRERKNPASALNAHPRFHGNPPSIYGKSKDGEDRGWTSWDDFVFGYKASSGQQPEEQQVEAEGPGEAPVPADAKEEAPGLPALRRSPRGSGASALGGCSQQREAEEAQEGVGEPSGAPAAASSCDQHVPLMWGETGGEEAQPLPEGAASGGSENGRRGPKATDREQQRPGSGPVRRSTRRQSGTSVERPHNRRSAPRRASGAALRKDSAAPAAAAAAAASEKPSSASLEAEKGMAVSFEEARTRVWSLGLGRAAGPGEGEQCWLKWCSRNGRHRVKQGLPVRPHEEYPGEWKDYDDFVLGWKAADAQQEEEEEEEEEEQQEEQQAEEEEEEEEEEQQAPEKSRGAPGAEASGDKEVFKATEEEEKDREEEATTTMAPDEGQEEQEEKSSAAGKGLEFLPFQKARDVVRGLALRSAYPSCKASTAWSNWYRKNLEARRELHLPSQPDAVYKKDGFDWDDFVGGGAAEREEEAAAEEEAAEEAVHEEEAITGREEQEDSQAAEKPHEEDPATSHSDEGSEQQTTTRRKSGAAGKKSSGWLPFKEAQAMVWTFGLRSAYPSNAARTAWEKWCQANGPRRSQLRLPTMPSSIYGKEEGFDLDYFVFGPREKGEASGASMNPGRSTRKRPRQREGSRDEDMGEEEEEAREAPERPRRRSGSSNRATAAAQQPTPELPRQVDDTLGVVLALRTRGQRVAVNLPLEESPQPSKARGSSAVLPRGKGAPAFPDLDGGAASGLETLTLVAEEPKGRQQEGLVEAPQSPASTAEEVHGGEGGDAAAPSAVEEASDKGGHEDAPEADLRAPTETTSPTTDPEGTPHPTEADGAPELSTAVVRPPAATPVAGGGAPGGFSQTLRKLISPSARPLRSGTSPGELLASLTGVFGDVVRGSKVLGERLFGAGRSPAPDPSKAPGLHGPTAPEASRAEDSTDGIFASLAPLDRSIAGDEPDEPEHLSRRQPQAGDSSPLGGAAGEQETGCSPSPMPWHQAYGDSSGSLSQQQEAKQGGADPAQRLRFGNPGLAEEAARAERRRSRRSGTVVAATPESSCARGSRKSKRGRQSIESVPSEVDSDMRQTRRRSGRLSQQHQGL